MVRIIIVLFTLFLFSDVLFCQNDSTSSTETEIVFALGTWPSYKGGVDSLNAFIKENIKSDKKDKTEGKVFIEFMVDTNGTTLDHKILKGISKNLDKEVLRVAKLIKFDKPAMQRGKPIKVKYIVPVEFKLEKNQDK